MALPESHTEAYRILLSERAKHLKVGKADGRARPEQMQALEGHLAAAREEIRLLKRPVHHKIRDWWNARA